MLLLSGLAIGREALAQTHLTGATLQTGAESAQLTLRLSGAVRPRVFRLTDPVRVVIDLAGTQRGSALRWPAPGGMVHVLRGAARGSGYRLVLELNQPLDQPPRLSSQVLAGNYQLQLALGASIPGAQSTGMAAANASPAAPAAPSAAASMAPAAAQAIRPAHMPAGREIVVAVDAGHGGEDPGASGPQGTHEKDVVLAIARQLAVRLNARAGMRAVLTRDGDRFIPLRERMERARRAHADLFVSVHADAVRDRSIAGASVYTLSDRGASNEAARWLADRENAADLRGGVSLADVNQTLASVLLSASQSAIMADSAEAAERVLGALDRVGAVRKAAVQHAAFVVLKSPDVPSMLVETAYISNPGEEQKLRSSAYQQQLAAAIETGVVAYFQEHPPDGTLAARGGSAAPERASESGS